MPNPKLSPQHSLLTCSKPSPVYKIPAASQLGSALSPQLHSLVCSSSASSMALPSSKSTQPFHSRITQRREMLLYDQMWQRPRLYFPLQTTHHRPMASPCGLQVSPAGQEFLLTHSRGAWMRRGEAMKAFERPESCQVSCARLLLLQ